jgi:hypothetical protein
MAEMGPGVNRQPRDIIIVKNNRPSSGGMMPRSYKTWLSFRRRWAPEADDLAALDDKITLSTSAGDDSF